MYVISNTEAVFQNFNFTFSCQSVRIIDNELFKADRKQIFTVSFDRPL